LIAKSFRLATTKENKATKEHKRKEKEIKMISSLIVI